MMWERKKIHKIFSSNCTLVRTLQTDWLAKLRHVKPGFSLQFAGAPGTARPRQMERGNVKVQSDVHSAVSRGRDEGLRLESPSSAECVYFSRQQQKGDTVLFLIRHISSAGSNHGQPASVASFQLRLSQKARAGEFLYENIILKACQLVIAQIKLLFLQTLWLDLHHGHHF